MLSLVRLSLLVQVNEVEVIENIAVDEAIVETSED